MFTVFVFICVALSMLGIGWFAGKKQDEEGYNLYNRKLSTLGYLVSYGATFIGAGFFITGTAYAYRYGLGLGWYFLGMIVGVIVFGYFAKYIKEKTTGLNLYTLPDFFRWRFGERAAKLVTGIILFLLAGDISIQLIGGGKLLASLGVLSYPFAIGITVVVVGIYLICSGFRAVVWTDYVLMIAIIFLTGILAVFSGTYFQPTQQQLDPLSVPIGIIVGFLLFGLFGSFSGPHYYQRIFAAGSSGIAKWGTWLSSLAILIPGIGLFIIGTAAKSMFPDIDPDIVFFRMIQFGGENIALVGALVLWAALMSSVDTLTFVGSQIFNKDVLKRKLSKRNISFGIIIFLGFGICISFILPSITSIAFMIIAGGMVIAPAAFFQWFMKKISERAVVASLACGAISLIVYASLCGITPNIVGVSFGVSTITLLLIHCIERIIYRLKS